MSYSIFVPIDIGETGLTLLATLKNSAGTIHASLRNLACNEEGDGHYSFTSSSIPDGYRGAIWFHTGSITSALTDSTLLYCSCSVSPQETENADVKTSSLSVSAGSGAYSITVTVTDGTDPLEDATVRVTKGVDTFTGQTDASGNASFSLDGGTYTVSATLTGYSFTPVSRTVTGDETGTLVDDIELTQIVVSAPTDPTLCRLYGYFLLPSGEVAIGQTVEATVNAARPTTTGAIVSGKTVSAVTDADGYAELDVIRTDEYEPTATYTITCQAAGLRISGVLLTTSTKDINTLI